MFQFPSNGKVHCKNDHIENFSATTTTVSIPFKRESALQVFKKPNNKGNRSEFQFPSNGKVHCKEPILSPVGPWVQKPKNIREVRGAFFYRNFSPKIAQTRVYTEPYAIFSQNGPKAKRPLGSWAIFAVSSTIGGSRMVLVLSIRESRKNVKFFPMRLWG